VNGAGVNSALHDLFFGSVAKIAQSGGRFLLAAMLARILGADRFGLFITIQWIVDFTFMVCAFGLNSVGPRFFPGLAVEGATFTTLDRLYTRAAVAVSLLTALVSTIAVWFWLKAADPELVGWVAAWAIVNSSTTLLLNRAQGLLRFRLFAAWTTSSVGLTVLLILIRANSLSVVEAVQCFVVANAICVLVHLVWGYRPAGRADSRAAPEDVPISPFATRDVVQYAMNSWVASTLSTLVWSRSELAILGRMVPLSEIGHYGSAATLVGLVAQLFGILMTSLAPRLSMWWNTGQYERAQRLSNEISLVLLLVAGLFGVLSVFYGDLLLGLVFGRDFAQGHLALAVLSLGSIGLSCASASQILQNQTNGRFGRNLNIVAGLVFLPLTAVLVAGFGLVGAAVSRGLIQGGSGIATFVWIERLQRDEPFRTTMVTRLVVALGVALAFVVGAQMAHIGDLPPTSGLRAAGFLVGCGCMVVVVFAGAAGLSWRGMIRVFLS
jgi:O-antigen/teichoic acid export membrane protein